MRDPGSILVLFGFLTIFVGGCRDSKTRRFELRDGGVDGPCAPGRMIVRGTVAGTPVRSTRADYAEPRPPGIGFTWMAYTSERGSVVATFRRAGRPGEDIAADLLVRLPQAAGDRLLCGRGTMNWDAAMTRIRLERPSILPACGKGTPLEGLVTFCTGLQEGMCGADLRNRTEVGLEGYENTVTDSLYSFGGARGSLSFEFPGLRGLADHPPMRSPGIGLLDDGTVVCFRGVEFGGFPTTDRWGDDDIPIRLRLSDFERLGRCDKGVFHPGDELDICVARRAW